MLLNKNREKTVPYLSSDEWTVLCTVHVGVKGHLKVLWRQKNKRVIAGDTQTQHNDNNDTLFPRQDTFGFKKKKANIHSFFHTHTNTIQHYVVSPHPAGNKLIKEVFRHHFIGSLGVFFMSGSCTLPALQLIRYRRDLEDSDFVFSVL